MLFEVGKYYKHVTSHMLHVLTEAETTLYGKTLIAESVGTKREALIAVGGDSESYTVNYEESAEEEWMKSFS